VLVFGMVAFLANALQTSAQAEIGACKPVKACEPVKVVPRVKVCEPVKVVPLPETCAPVKVVPPPKTCEPVKTCDSVKDHHWYLHGRYVYEGTPVKHHLFKHDERTVYYTSPQQETAPVNGKPVEPTQAPANAPAPPTPDKA
jgi:hypothetical protein